MKKQIFLRITCLILAVISGFNLFSTIACWVIADVFAGISFNISSASTIGIIGGADGPTAIFVTAVQPHIWEWILWSALLVVSVCGYHHFQKRK